MSAWRDPRFAELDRLIAAEVAAKRVRAKPVPGKIDAPRQLKGKCPMCGVPTPQGGMCAKCHKVYARKWAREHKRPSTRARMLVWGCATRTPTPRTTATETHRSTRPDTLDTPDAPGAVL